MTYVKKSAFKKIMWIIEFNFVASLKERSATKVVPGEIKSYLNLNNRI
jgi:hypothetical protein